MLIENYSMTISSVQTNYYCKSAYIMLFSSQRYGVKFNCTPSPSMNLIDDMKEAYDVSWIISKIHQSLLKRPQGLSIEVLFL